MGYKMTVIILYVNRHYILTGIAAMRFDKGHKEQTRRRIVEIAAQRFRKEGVAAVGIAGLMADAGLTHGGFYAHFPSKEDLVRAALDEASAQNEARRSKVLEQTEPGAARAEALIRNYLRPAHRDAPELGCAAAALIAEIARHEPETRAAFTERLNGMLAQFETSLPTDLEPEIRRRRTIGIFATLLGALQMARAVDDPALSDSILDSGIEAALSQVHLG
jgi:TetR/AcrR family transcriptional regulator, transcriptional repressor for nem operon